MGLSAENVCNDMENSELQCRINIRVEQLDAVVEFYEDEKFGVLQDF